jgi:hypothetical protein
MRKTELTKEQQGRRNRQKGSEFERKVRKELEDDGWFVIKNPNKVNFEKNKFTSSKPKFNPFTKKIMMYGNGFPDFICYRIDTKIKGYDYCLYKIIGVECKTNGYLSKEEKKMCDWILAQGLFREMWIAKKDKNGNVAYKSYGEA